MRKSKKITIKYDMLFIDIIYMYKKLEKVIILFSFPEINPSKENPKS